MPTPEAIRKTLLKLAGEREPNKTFCPSEAARRLDAGYWRGLMPEVKAQAQKLVEKGQLRVTQKGREVDWNEAKGPVRLQIRK